MNQWFLFSTQDSVQEPLHILLQMRSISPKQMYIPDCSSTTHQAVSASKALSSHIYKVISVSVAVGNHGQTVPTLPQTAGTVPQIKPVRHTWGLMSANTKFHSQIVSLGHNLATFNCCLCRHPERTICRIVAETRAFSQSQPCRSRLSPRTFWRCRKRDQT